MDVPRQLSNEIDRWFQEGEKTGKWGGFDRLGLAEGDILDVVQCQRAASP
jgi:hypothetical protein